MKNRGLSESLLSSSQNLIQDKHQLIVQKQQDSHLPKLYRKFNETLPELYNENTQQNKPLITSLVFSPQSKFIIGWKILNVALTYLYFLQIPIILAYENHRSQEYNERVFKVINTPTIIVFVCGIFIDMNTSFYQNGLLRKETQEIRRRYFKSKFVVDLISILTIVIYEIIEVTKQFENQSLKVFVVLFFIKHAELKKAENIIICSFDLHRRIKAAFKFFTLLLKILLVCNIAACSAFFMSSYLLEHQLIIDSQGNQCTNECYWIMNVTFAGKPLYQYSSNFEIQYVYSLYWASTTMTSIGYGDITPKNPFQVGFTVFLQFVSCVLYAYSINQVQSIIRELYAKQTKIHSRLNTINVYMRDKQINNDLVSKVNAYLNNFYFSKNLRERDIESQIINELTPSLRKQLYYQSYSALFSHKYFNNINKTLKQSLCCQVRQVGYYEAQRIFIDRQHRQPCLYYIKKGQLKYQCGERTNTLIKQLYTKDIFGIYQFFSLLLFKSQLKANKYTLLFFIKACDWKKALKNYQQDFQKYYEAKDEIILYNNGYVVGHSCEYCNSKRHRTEDCLDYQLRRAILEAINQSKIRFNKRILYFRKDYKPKVHERQKKRRKYTMKNSQLHSRLEASTRSIRFQLLQNSRKSSMQEHFEHKKDKYKIKNQRSKNQNLKALQKIRKMHKNDDLSEVSSETESIFLMGYEELSIDSVKEYDEYYPSFNISQINLREKEYNRRRRNLRIR